MKASTIVVSRAASWRSALASFSLLAISIGTSAPTHPASLSVVNLVTDDQTANKAQLTDPELKNAWGISGTGGREYFVSSNGAGKALLYDLGPRNKPPSVSKRSDYDITIPGVAGKRGSPTGVVDSGGRLDAVFMSVSEDGTIAGWYYPGAANVVRYGSNANVYKGATIAHYVDSVCCSGYMYMANFKKGTIDVLTGSNAPKLTGNFVDPNLPSNMTPFNVENLDGTLYVAYAVPDVDRRNAVAGAGNGVVDEFDLEGNFLRRVATGGQLNSPWGLAIAPPSFGALAGRLLVGNSGDGRINAFDLKNLANSPAALIDQDGKPIVIEGLHSLYSDEGPYYRVFGQDILFSSGPEAGSHALLGLLTACSLGDCQQPTIPEPSTSALLVFGLASLVFTMGRRSRDKLRLNPSSVGSLEGPP